MPRMQILNALEREAFETPPVFTSLQRRQHFDFPAGIQRLATALRTPANRLGFLLHAGYFVAAKRFFLVRTFQPRDLAYVAGRLGLGPDPPALAPYDGHTLARHQAAIRRYYGFRPFEALGRAVLGEEIARLVAAQLKPKVIFWRCVDLLVREKIEVPGYFPLAALILRAINRRNWALVDACEQALTPGVRALLDELLVQEPADAGASVGKTTAYRLTLLKKLSQSTQPAKVKARVADLTVLAGLHDQLQPVLKALALSPEGIHYYARPSSGATSSSSRVDGRRSGTSTSSPSSPTSSTASRTTSSTCCSPASRPSTTAPSGSTRSSATSAGSSTCRPFAHSSARSTPGCTRWRRSRALRGIRASPMPRRSRGLRRCWRRGRRPGCSSGRP
jgi:hypothetical protein